MTRVTTDRKRLSLKPARRMPHPLKTCENDSVTHVTHAGQGRPAWSYPTLILPRFAERARRQSTWRCARSPPPTQTIAQRQRHIDRAKALPAGDGDHVHALDSQRTQDQTVPTA